MTDHDGQRALFDHCFVDFAVTFIPFRNGQTVHGAHQMPITLVHAVARKMFDCRRDAVLMQAFHLLTGKTDHLIDVRAERPDVRDRVFEVHVDVHDRGKRPVAADCLRFTAGNKAQLIGFLLIGCRRDTHRPAVVRAVRADSVSAGFQVGRQQQRDFAFFLQNPVRLPDRFCRHRTEHHPARLIFLYKFRQCLIFRISGNRAENLPDFLFRCHLAYCIFYPRNLVIR
ncbi:hypothetical protein SDC9_58115 [bioreactor metagenome]|uniref:Uncharacterized protein n=1 Tax=bioreactor metagenome TaxID=1076179 RepID=A0A644XC64_9ZZZZ